MQAFTIGVGRSWLLRALGRNPLVRGSDRIEAAAVAIAVLVTVAALPFVAALGTSSYETRARLYADQAATSHTVVATAIEDSTPIIRPNAVTFVVRAQWETVRGTRTEVIGWPDRAKPGDRETIWVNRAGDEVSPPVARGRAASDAVGIAVALWLALACLATGAVWLTRRRLERTRLAGWGHELDSLTDDDGGRNRRS